MCGVTIAHYQSSRAHMPQRSNVCRPNGLCVITRSLSLSLSNRHYSIISRHRCLIDWTHQLCAFHSWYSSAFYGRTASTIRSDHPIKSSGRRKVSSISQFPLFASMLDCAFSRFTSDEFYRYFREQRFRWQWGSHTKSVWLETFESIPRAKYLYNLSTV